MFAKLAAVAILATAIGVQARPQGSGEHTCNQLCLASSAAHGLPPQGCAADDLSCLGCADSGFVDAMTECLQQVCHENVTLTCATGVARRQEASSTIAPGATASSSESESSAAPGVTESSSSAPADASGSGTLEPSASASVGSTASSGASGSAGPSASGSSQAPGPSASAGSHSSAPGASGSQAGGSGTKQTISLTASGSNTAAGSQNTDGGNGNGNNTSAAMGISAPLNSVFGAGVAAVALLASSGLLL